jgi:hypothetical protein
MATNKFKLSLTLLIIGSAVMTLVVQRQANAKLRAEIQTLRQQVGGLQADNERLSDHPARAKGLRAPRLPAPPVSAAVTPGPNRPRHRPARTCSAGFQGLRPKLPTG